MKLQVNKAYYSSNPAAPATLYVTNLENQKEFKMKVWQCVESRGIKKGTVIIVDKDKPKPKKEPKPKLFSNKNLMLLI